MKDLIHQILQYRVDGILITSVTLTSDLADTCVDFGVPVVLFNRYMNTPGIQAVCCDNVQAGRDCADYFFMKGYRSFAFIGGHDEASTSHDRRRGFVSRLEERGIHDCPVINTPLPTREAGKDSESFWSRKAPAPRPCSVSATWSAPESWTAPAPNTG